MKLRIALTALLLTASTLTISSTAAQAAGCSSSSTNATASQAAGRRPVIFVHGWTSNGKGLEGTGKALAERTGKRIQPFYFDYGSNSTTWAADKIVAGCLADYIVAVSDAYAKKSGGDRKIILVGHSMGGLASLYAAQNGKAMDRIGGMITFDTPYLGSPFGNTGVAGWLQGLHQGVGSKLIPPIGSDAQICLGQHKDGVGLVKGCDAKLPGYMPVAAGVTAIAGDITVKRTFGPFHLYDIPLSSDGIVPVDSQHGYLQIQKKASWPMGQKIRLKSDSCTITNDSMMRTLKAAGRGGAGGIISALLSANVELKVDGNALGGLLEDRLTPALALYLGVATFTADCSHIKVTNHGPALDHAADSLKEYLNLLEPGTAVRNLVPVTSDGEVAAGWSVVDGADAGGVDCSFNSASPAAKRGNIYYCSPSAARADACWVEAGRNSVLCLSDPMSRKVVRLWMEGAFGAALPTGPAEYSGIPSPIRLDLDNGARCRLRNGGSWGIQESKPDLVGFYGCDNGEVVWASRDSRTGIDQSSKTWTVQTGKESGGLTRRKVQIGYYVATG
ncbi:alpha/beta fold hydrolase [Micromonospora sp. WMMD967]|uniref:alpha/beta fold hydrolase n=1 Tax=Micromonospora sp. WMMD967 TaxID=3016101 RepID=UPI00241782B3|nr:alpha/beta fold hydrolase [Micromonospora sp. WMMD967]MDG4838342.1 alpha/beta fold hydrolase [Micromonospora sp. WMMD967]